MTGSGGMGKSRVEAFSDGVIAIIITIMVLELKVPHGEDFAALRELWPVFLSYVLSFVYIGIYWSNHHHLIHTVTKVNGRIMWANLHLLFWLSLVPFTTGWMGENHFASMPVMLYGINLLAAALAYELLSNAIIATHGIDSTLGRAVIGGKKDLISIAAYVLAIAVALFEPWISCAVFAFVAAMWLVPDPRIAKQMGE
jgi:uncharacterized membrane protein